MQATTVLARARSVRRGILACSSLSGREATSEMALVLAQGLRECENDLVRADHPDRPRELVILLTAEKYWMEALLDLVDDLEADPGEVVSAVLAALPHDE
jgi:hypothetical protein